MLALIVSTREMDSSSGIETSLTVIGIFSSDCPREGAINETAISIADASLRVFIARGKL